MAHTTINTKTTAAVTEENILDSKELRDKMSDRIEVLDKVKQLFLIPEMECMTTQQMADYFEVNYETIKWQYKSNRGEFDEDGTHFKQLIDFKNLVGSKTPNLKIAQRRGFLELTLPDGTIVAINNKGVNCFPKRAILRMGMLLRDSRIAKEIRTQLLNVFEHTTTDQRVAEIDKERKLLDAIWEAWGTDDIDEVMKASAALDGYRKRHINRLEQHNAELTEEVTAAAPKVEFYDAVAESGHLISVSEFSKTVFREFGKDLGRNGIYEWLRESGYIRDNNEPYQKYVNAGYFVGRMMRGQMPKTGEYRCRLFFTGKGQQFILARLREAFPKINNNKSR